MTSNTGMQHQVSPGNQRERPSHSYDTDVADSGSMQHPGRRQRLASSAAAGGGTKRSYQDMECGHQHPQQQQQQPFDPAGVALALAPCTPHHAADLIPDDLLPEHALAAQAAESLPAGAELHWDSHADTPYTAEAAADDSSALWSLSQQQAGVGWPSAEQLQLRMLDAVDGLDQHEPFQWATSGGTAAAAAAASPVPVSWEPAVPPPPWLQQQAPRPDPALPVLEQPTAAAALGTSYPGHLQPQPYTPPVPIQNLQILAAPQCAAAPNLPTSSPPASGANIAVPSADAGGAG
jgi:hypothetical protein